MTESEYIQQHENYLHSIVSRFIARYPEQRWKMRDDLMQEARMVDCQASATPKKTSKGVRQPNLLRGL